MAHVISKTQMPFRERNIKTTLKAQPRTTDPFSTKAKRPKGNIRTTSRAH